MKDIESIKRHNFRLTFLGLSLLMGFFFISLFSKHAYHLARWIGYVIGLTGYWIGLPLLLFFFLSCFVLGHKPKWLGIRLSIGIVITLLGISIIWAFAGLKGETNFDYSVYDSAFDAKTNILFTNEIGGGLLGTLLASCFKATGVDALVYVFALMILLGGLVITFLPLIISLAKKCAAKRAINRSKKAQNKAEAKQKEKEEKQIRENTSTYLESLGIQSNPKERPTLERPTLGFESNQNAQMSRIEEREAADVHLAPKKEICEEPHFINNGQQAKEAIFIIKPKESEQKTISRNIDSFNSNQNVSFKAQKQKEGVINVTEQAEEQSQPIETPKIIEKQRTIEVPVQFKAQEAKEEQFDEESNEKDEYFKEVASEPTFMNHIPQTNQNPIKETPKAAESSPFPKAKARPPYILPGLDLLKDYDNEEAKEAQLSECEGRKEKINKVFQNLKIGAHVVSYEVGPSVTRYNIETDDDVLPGIINKSVSKIRSALGGVTANYEESVIGSMYSALEIPNEQRMTVSLKEVISALPPLSEKTRTYIPFGEAISGSFYSADLTEFPHMLVAGTTGSGKSVYNNSVILSLLMRNRPEDLKLVMVDPKQVEFMMFEDIPHLLCPIITDPKEAKVAIEKLVEEMERRNSIIRKAGVKKLSEYNKFAKEHGYETLPYIVFVVDEFADLMMTCKGVDELIARLAGKSRSSGIHMIICTQRPSVDVISGVIKANIIVRVALSVSSPTDSITILGEGGAENLAGYGDMLVTCGQVIRNANFRAQGCYVDNDEIRDVVNFIKSQQTVEYDPRFMDLSGKVVDVTPSRSKTEYGMNAGTERDDPIYEEVKEKVMRCEYYSMSRMNREFHFGYTRSGKIFQWLKEDGIIEDDDNKANSRGCKVLIRVSDDMDNPGSSDNSDFIPS